MNPIIFLDIDGVLNNADLMHLYKIQIYNQFALRIRKVCDLFDADIVVSSSWRSTNPEMWEQLKQLLRCAGIPYRRIIDQTPYICEPHRVRGDEIQAWLDANNPERPYVIIDDSDDMLDSQMDRFVDTSWYEGLTEAKCEEMIQVLEKQGLTKKDIDDAYYNLPS